jgi:hypothetical protein
MLISLKQLIKASAHGLIIFSLSACSTIEIIHVPVGCIEQSQAKLGFTDEEIDSTSDEMTDKLVIFAGALRERLTTQCLINKKHDQLHGDK